METNWTNYGKWRHGEQRQKYIDAMSNKLDKQYTDLLKTILEHGVDKKDRTGTGTKSIFGYTIRHNMKDGFPLLTTKKMPFKTIVTELLWFLRGDTNIKYLVDNNCHIWDGDAYKNYLNVVMYEKPDYLHEKYGHLSLSVKREGDNYIPYTQEEFINKIKTDDKFAKTWGDLGPIYGKQWRKWTVPRMEPKGFDFDKAWEKSQELWKSSNGMECGPSFETFCMSLLRSKKMGIAYGYHTEIDQIQNLINDLKTNPDSRRLMVNAWNVSELDAMVLPPCHYGFQVYTRELSLDEMKGLLSKSLSKRFPPLSVNVFMKMGDGYDEFKEILETENIPTRAISLMWNQRSCDFPLGIPFNIASYGLLLEILAKIVNMVPDELIGNLGDCHIYLNQIEGCKEQIQREGLKLPTFDCPAMDEIPYSTFDELVSRLLPCDFYMDDYESHPAIKFPLSN